MWEKSITKKLENLGIPLHMLDRSSIGLRAHTKPIIQLFEQRSIPDEGWNDDQITQLLYVLSHLDSDKDPQSIRIGEREGRISTQLLSNQIGGFCHGVGRSGELAAPQPKAAGASLMQNLSNKVSFSLLKSLGLSNIKSSLVVPMGTGMSLGLALRGALTHFQINSTKKNMVLMTQIDHNSPIKGIKYIGAEIITIPGHFGKNYYASEGVYTDMAEIESIFQKNSDSVCAIITNCAFFAPRVPDNIKEISKFAKKNELIHIINNAYGVQSSDILKIIRGAIDAGKVDAIIQSTDKCFLTPVGGAIIASPNSELIQTISKSYAGRASAAPAMHLLTSLLSMGKNGYLSKMKQQKENLFILQSELKNLAENLGEKLIDCGNKVSCALTLSKFSQDQISKLGGFLYNLRVTGPRIIDLNKSEFGSCTNKTEIPFSYVVMNAAIGVEKKHILLAIQMLKKAFIQIQDK
ncbi:O-phosphoseryl-tRNA(Sec) selenium transferase [Candidatus Lokiarchaeum ossiferum]|uniref:O-phosphoseryl-tRNA(Sec) selenium transferase n=1 Tax=Candidatus Lokiarchaeum ossiferum TaxID=2951803 RepID=UPI00352F37A4